MLLSGIKKLAHAVSSHKIRVSTICSIHSSDLLLEGWKVGEWLWTATSALWLHGSGSLAHPHQFPCLSCSLWLSISAWGSRVLDDRLSTWRGEEGLGWVHPGIPKDHKLLVVALWSILTLLQHDLPNSSWRQSLNEEASFWDAQRVLRSFFPALTSRHSHHKNISHVGKEMSNTVTMANTATFAGAP